MSNDSAITVTIRRRVRAGRDADFEATLREFIPQSLAFPGHLGVHVMRPAPGASPEWLVVIRFRTRGDYDAFRTSPEYSRWSALIRDLLEADPVVEEECGLESWFALPGATVVPTMPRWKMAVVTWLGVNVAVIGLTLAIGPLLAEWSLIPKALFMNALVVALLTWAIMPLLSRLFRPWLHRSGTGEATASPNEERL